MALAFELGSAILVLNPLVQANHFQNHLGYSARIRAAFVSISLSPSAQASLIQAKAASSSAESPDEDGDAAADDDSNPEAENLKWDMNPDSPGFRESLERIVDNKDASFSGRDLASLIRKKYGRSYDVQMIRKEFMGRQLLAMNVMWKYREQRSFPLSEEEYILHLDDIANTLKYWGAVSVIRSSLEKTKERPRIGKAVSIFIDMDESGGRAKEWINR